MRAKLEICSIVLVFILLGISCTDRNDTMTGVGGASFTVKISGGMSETRSAAVQGKEGITIPLHLFLFKKGAADSAIPDYYQSGELKNNEATTMICTPDGSFDLTLQYDIYVVGCDENETISPTASKATLLSMIQENIVDINSGDKLYMLAGRTLDASLNTQTTEVKIVRNVCRLNLTLADESGFSYTDISATLSIPDKTYVFDSGVRGSVNTLPTGTQNINQSFDLTLDADTWEGDAFYFFENKTTVAGIKSDNDKVRLTITATGAAGQKKYSTYLNKAGGFITQRNTIYKVNATLRNGQIYVETDAIPWDAEVNDDISLDQVLIEPKANCYIVKPNEGTIYIPVSQVNDASAFDSDIPSITLDERLTTELVWTDVKGTGSGKGLAADASVKSIELIGKGADAVIRVVSGSESGNSVVAIKGADGKVKWSWHIWVTDYDPSVEVGQNTSGGYIFMDRNLGAKSTTSSFEGIDVVGNYYQYGRKDPFPTKNIGLTQVQAYNAAGENITRTTGNATSLVNMIQQPFMWANTPGYPTDLELWGENGDKTTNDPCPAGWRVPRRDAWIDLTDKIFPRIGAGNVGRQGKHTGFYPNSWHIFPNGNFQTAYKFVHNWSSTPSGTDNAFYLRAGSELSEPATVQVNYAYSRGSGWAVRCVKDWTKEKFENEIRVLTVGFASLSASHPLDVASRSMHGQSDLVSHLLSVNFGSNEKVNAIFKFYSWDQPEDQYELGLFPLLDKYEIDVLYLCCYENPAVERSQKIKEWVAAKPNRVLIYAADWAVNANINISKAYGIEHFQEIGGVDSELADYDDPLYQSIVNGPYGKISDPLFKCAYNAGYANRNTLIAKGFVPILTYVPGPANYIDNVTLAIHPEHRVIMLGDTDFFGATNQGSPKDGSLAKATKGEYPLLMANLWAWISKTVLGDDRIQTK